MGRGDGRRGLARVVVGSEPAGAREAGEDDGDARNAQDWAFSDLSSILFRDGGNC
jgi:hypothetical protein